MKATIYGTVATIGQPAEERSAGGRFLGAHAFRSLDLTLGSPMIDLDHNGEPAGEIVYAEVEHERINLVGVIENGDGLAAIDAPIYLSGLWEMRGKDIDKPVLFAREAQLLAASLTLSPATVAARPLRRLRGDIRNSTDRFSKWPSSWAYNAPLLERAFNSIGKGLAAERATASRIVDVASEAESERIRAQWKQEQSLYETRAPRDAHADLWARHGPGAHIEWSRHAGRVLSVR